MSYQFKCEDMELMLKACEYYRSFAKDNTDMNVRYERICSKLKIYTDQNLQCEI